MVNDALHAVYTDQEMLAHPLFAPIELQAMQRLEFGSSVGHMSEQPLTSQKV